MELLRMVSLNIDLGSFVCIPRVEVDSRVSGVLAQEIPTNSLNLWKYIKRLHVALLTMLLESG